MHFDMRSLFSVLQSDFEGNDDHETNPDGA